MRIDQISDVSLVDKKFARKHFETIRGGYDFDAIGSGSIPLIAAIQGEFGINFNEGMNRYLRRVQEEKRRSDFEGCLIPSMEIFFRNYGLKFKNSIALKYIFNSRFHLDKLPENSLCFYAKTEGDLLNIMASQSISSFKNRLPKDTQNNILQFKQGKKNNIKGLEHKVRVAYIPYNMLKNFLEDKEGNFDPSKYGINGMLFKSKSYESIVIKEAVRMRRIYMPTSEEIDKYSKTGKKIEKKVLIDAFKLWIKNIYSSKEDFISAYLGEFTPSTYGPVIELLGRDNFNPIEINELFGDVNMLDISGVAINTTSSRNIRKITSVIDYINRSEKRFVNLPHKVETTAGKKNQKDGGLVRCLRDSNEGHCAEFRVSSVDVAYTAQFGSKQSGMNAHPAHRLSEINLLGRACIESSEMLKIIENLCTLYNLTPAEIGLNNLSLV